MDQFRKLDPDTRTLALIGKFLQSWALMEARLNDVLVKALGLGNINGVIVARNIQLRDKTKIVKTAIDLSFFGSSEEKQKYIKLIEHISDFSAKRNIVAHEFFCPSDDGESVEFMVIKANGKLLFPEEKWSTETFAEHFAVMDGFYLDLKALTGKLGTSAVVKALMEAQSHEPKQSLGLLGLGGLLNHQPLGPLGSNPLPSTPETAAEKPPKRARKAAPRKP